MYKRKHQMQLVTLTSIQQMSKLKKSDYLTCLLCRYCASLDWSVNSARVRDINNGKHTIVVKLHQYNISEISFL